MKISKDKAHGRWKMPKPLRLSTPDRIARAEAEQRERARLFNSPHLTHAPAERERARALGAVEHLTGNLKLVEREMGAALVGGEVAAARFAELNEARAALRRQLAENHAVLGRYDLAAAAEDDAARRVRYQRIWRAVWRRDEAVCACPPAHRFVAQDVYSLRHGREMALVACTECPHLNVTDVPPHVLTGRAARRAAAQLVGGMTPADARGVLTAHRHTTREVLG